MSARSWPTTARAFTGGRLSYFLLWPRWRLVRALQAHEEPKQERARKKEKEHMAPTGMDEAPTEMDIVAPTEDQSWLMLSGLLISIVWTMRLIYYHVEPHIWHDVQVKHRWHTAPPSHTPCACCF